MSYKKFPPLQAPETYNLDGILKAVEEGAAIRANRKLARADSNVNR